LAVTKRDQAAEVQPGDVLEEDPLDRILRTEREDLVEAGALYESRMLDQAGHWPDDMQLHALPLL
jgi:hypothetical protein